MLNSTGKSTKGYVGISESLFGTSVAGGIYALLSCQPLVILATTGGTLVFEDSLFKVTESISESHFKLSNLVVAFSFFFLIPLLRTVLLINGIGERIFSLSILGCRLDVPDLSGRSGG